MDNNELLRSLRKLLAVNEVGMMEIYQLGGKTITPELARNWLRHANEKEFKPCSAADVHTFMQGLIVYKRGPSDNPPSVESPYLNNNQILKKLRIALQLQDQDMHQLFEDSGNPLSKQELKALFRSQDHRNFIACSDTLLRHFLTSLIQRYRPESDKDNKNKSDLPNQS